MNYPQYTDYKDSKVDWLEDLPKHWDIKKSKLLYREVIDLSTTGCEDLLSVSEYYGVKKRTEVMKDGDHISRAESLEGYKKCKPDDLVINIMLAWKRGLGISSFDGIVSPAYSVFRPIDQNSMNPKYFHYLLRTDLYTGYFKSRSTGIIDSRLRLYPDAFGTIKIICPSKYEQDTIVAFLDRETEKIDVLIAEQQRLIDLLKEKRQAIITHAVTKGLNPDTPMKDSGVEWLGHVPKNWDILTIRRVATSVQTGNTPSSELASPDLETGFDWYTPGDFTDSLCLGNSLKKITSTVVASGESRLFPPGSVLIVSIGGTLGKVGYTKKSASANQQINAVIPNERVDGYFLAYSLVCKAKIMRFMSNASTIGIMNQEKTKELWITVPPLREQMVISTFLDRETAKVDVLVNEAQKAIALLQERSKAIIFEAVTGKIDVRKIGKENKQ